MSSEIGTLLLWSSLGFFTGAFFGVGCALAVMYTIYRNGYRRAVQDSFLESKPERYEEALRYLKKHRSAEMASGKPANWLQL